MIASRNVLETFRDVVQDLLLPEIRAMKVSIDSLRTEMKMGDQMLEQSIRLGNEKTEAAIGYLAARFESAIEIRERLAVLEARSPRQ